MDAAADLLVQGACPGCGRPGRGVCPDCTLEVMSGRPGPRERGGISLPLWSAGEYVDPLRRIISRAKDHHRWDAIALLGRRLGFAVAGIADELHLTGPGILLPIPSKPSAVRERGLDFTQALARQASRCLVHVGMTTTVHPVLTHRRAVQDQGDLTSEQRSENLERSLMMGKLPMNRWILLVDDVVTTGATLRESVRAVREAGRSPVGMATVAATVLRKRSSTNIGVSLPNLRASGYG